MGLFSSSTFYSRLLAPSLAGFLISSAGFSPVFMVCSVSGLIALLIFLKFPKTDIIKRDVNRNFKEGFRRILSIPMLLILAIVNASIYFGLQGIETFLPLLIKNMGINPFITGIIFT